MYSCGNGIATDLPGSLGNDVTLTTKRALQIRLQGSEDANNQVTAL